MWLYEKNYNNSARFVLGEHGKRPLVCFGINPSTAVPDNLDRTLSRVRNESKDRGFDGWIMFNLYPQRATNPENMHKAIESRIHKINKQHIRDIFIRYSNLTVWAAWGGIIQKRPFLKNCLREIVTMLPSSVKWVHMGELVAKQHPHHPLYLKKGLPFRSFDMNRYLKIDC